MNKINVIAICFFVFAAYLTSTHAYAESETSAQFRACMDNVNPGGFKNSQWEVCAEEEIKRQDVILNY